MRVPFPAECWLGVFFSLFVCHASFPRTSMTSLRSTHSPAWSWWKSMWSLWKRGRRLSKTTPNSWGKPSMFLFLGSLFSRGPSASERSRVSVFVCVRLRFACFKKAVYEMFVRSYDHSGTESSLSTKHWPHSPAAVCSLQPSFSSRCVHVAPSLLAPAPLPPCPGCRLHIWCSAELCWRGEEVGADWHMTYRMWSRGRVKGGRAAFFDVHSGLMFLIQLFEIKENLKLRWLFWGPPAPPPPSEVWRCLSVCFHCTFTFCRNLSKKYNPKRSSKDEPECRWATVVFACKAFLKISTT